MNFDSYNYDLFDLIIVICVFTFFAGIIVNYAFHGARLGTNLSLVGVIGLILGDYLKSHYKIKNI